MTDEEIVEKAVKTWKEYADRSSRPLVRRAIRALRTNPDGVSTRRVGMKARNKDRDLIAAYDVLMQAGFAARSVRVVEKKRPERGYAYYVYQLKKEYQNDPA